MFHLGWLYEKGRGVPKNLKIAIDLYRQTAAAGNAEAKRGLVQLAGS
jgi:TPR repeat protein